MAKNSITDYSGTSSNNSDVQSVDISEGCSPSGINNAIREVMADLADVNDGTVALTSPSAVTLSTDTISEKTSGSGVTIDSVLLKDGALGSIASAVAAHLTSINGGQIGGNRNLIINGAMQVAQRGTSATSLGNGNSGYHTVDRFRFAEGGSPTYAFTMSQSTTAPTGFSNSLKLDCTTADTSLASTDALLVEQFIEAQNLQHLKYGTTSAESVTLSFWVRSNLTGTFAVWFYQEDDNRAASKTYTISAADTWEHKTITLSGDQTGVIDNNNGQGFRIAWYLASGTSYTSGTANTDWQTLDNTNRAAGLNVNLASSTSNEWYLTGVQLEVGSTATEFEHRAFGDELARCMRYYYRIDHSNTTGQIALGHQIDADDIIAAFHLPQPLRATPTISFDKVRIHHNNTTEEGNFTCNNIYLNQSMLGLNFDTSSTPFSSDQSCAISVNTNGYLEVIAEL